jgi:hypothetical protein
MEYTPGRQPAFSPSRAFVVQFLAETHIEAGHMVGRVEHVISGEATRFQSLDTLLAFLARVLREVRQAPPADAPYGLC